MKIFLNGLLICCLLILAGCASQNTEPTPTATLHPSQISTVTRVPTRTSTPTATARPEIILEPFSDFFPLPWNTISFSEEQLHEAQICDIMGLADQRYPSSLSNEDLIYAFEPQSSCDWAVLAFAYVRIAEEAGEDTLPEIAHNAFAKAVSENPAMLFSTYIFYTYSFVDMEIVDLPPLSETEISKVRVEYVYYGIGDEVQYTFEIRQANTSPTVVMITNSLEGEEAQINTAIDIETVQALGKSLINLLPIEEQFSIVPCTDTSPDWVVTITQVDGNEIVLKNHQSNMIRIGGPWQTNIDGQDYVQFSLEFIIALDEIIKETGLRHGQPMGMFCAPESVIYKAFPDEED
jgi:hypothetical protein